MIETQQIEKTLAYQLAKNLPAHSISDVYYYASLPGGKLFRPHLVWSICEDLSPTLFASSSLNMNSNHAKFASSVEFHHTYTLLHDDLPAMDNDLTRRGKPCTHIAYGEWQALLAGDGLLNISYQLQAQINHSRTLQLIKLSSWALGPKGLIHGQVLDLSHEMTKSFSNTLRTHELKTARLIQVAIMGSAILSLTHKDSKKEKALWRYSKLLGINFQLIDDLSELAEKELSKHEKDVNPWLHFTQESYAETLIGLKKFEVLAQELNLKTTNKIVSDYYSKMLSIIENAQETINGHLENRVDLIPVILLMKSFGNL